MDEDILKLTKKFLYIMGIYFVIVIGIVIYTNVQHNKDTSSPVEEMYHRQLVVTLDSILDARFGPGCCEEDIDTVSANTFRTHIGNMILPVK